jgi:hypothetical protein
VLDALHVALARRSVRDVHHDLLRGLGLTGSGLTPVECCASRGVRDVVTQSKTSAGEGDSERRERYEMMIHWFSLSFFMER